MTSESKPEARPFVYRLFNADGELLYIGVSTRGLLRVREHINGKPWGRDVAQATFEHYDHLDEAYKAESKAISNERPRYDASIAAQLARQAAPRAQAPTPVVLPPAETELIERTVDEMAALLGLQPRSVRRLARVRGLGRKVGGKVWLFSQADVATMAAIDRDGGWHEQKRNREKRQA